MKIWKCSCCSKTKETKDKIFVVICNSCQIEMKEIKGDEINGDNRR